MDVFVRSRGIASADVPQQEIERLVRSAVDRFESRVPEVTVHVVDVNGPRGGVDKICTISAKLDTGVALEATDCQSNLLTAIHRAARRLASRIAGHVSPKRPRISIRYPDLPAA